MDTSVLCLVIGPQNMAWAQIQTSPSLQFVHQENIGIEDQLTSFNILPQHAEFLAAISGVYKN